MNSSKIDKILDSLNPKEYLPTDRNKFLISGDITRFFNHNNIFDKEKVSKKTKAKDYFQKIVKGESDQIIEENQEMLVERVKLLNENLCK